MQINLGCGTDYKEEWINVDVNKEVKADVYCDLNKEFPFKDNSIDEIYWEDCIEHIKKDRLFWLIDEIYCACKNNAIITIRTPHYTGTSAFKHLGHYSYFGIGSFGIYLENTKDGEKYGNAKFKILKEELRLLVKDSQYFSFMYVLTLPLNWFFNLFGTRWKIFWEKFNIFGFEEIEYVLEVVK